MYRAIDGSQCLLPSTVQIDVEANRLGMSKSIDIVKFDFVSQLLSLLQDKTLMQSKHLVVNQPPAHPFGFYQSPDGRLGECHTGYVYQHLYVKHIQDPSRQLLCPLILYMDQTNVDKFGRFQLEPLSFTTSLFNMKTRQRAPAWLHI